jgi:hypothetical protein
MATKCFDLCSGVNCALREHCIRYEKGAKNTKLKPPKSLPDSCLNFVPRTSYGSCSPGAGEQPLLSTENAKI